ncbi:hypothetical protein F2Q69_00008268 [Brassica cretica]|uniref:Uncharacterized protein n=1 Tax=Brassica cretica TaxID=69181 RepID=A0A8S9NUC0_BRACR|nr:hypothetical protein F2Q69_00008268 [Brassica cretica]
MRLTGRWLRNQLGRYVATERLLGRYVATELWLELGRYVATKLLLDLGRYVATEPWLGLGRYVATELLLDLSRYLAAELLLELGHYVATEPWLELGRYVATEPLARDRSLRSDRAERVFCCCVATLFELLFDDSRFFRKAFRKEESFTKKYLSKKVSTFFFFGDLDVNFVVTVFDPNSLCLFNFTIIVSDLCNPTYVLSDLDHVCLPIDADRFRFNFHEVLKPTMDSGVTSIVSCYNFKIIFNLIAYLRNYRHLKAPFNCNFPTNDVDVVGHMKLLNGQMLIGRPVLHEVATATTQRVLIHLQTK